VFRQCISVLFSIVSITPRIKTSSPGSMSVIFDKLHARAHRVLERLWQANATGVLECFTYCWSGEAEVGAFPLCSAEDYFSRLSVTIASRTQQHL
jgi:hypothetical protein